MMTICPRQLKCMRLFLNRLVRARRNRIGPIRLVRLLVSFGQILFVLMLVSKCYLALCSLDSFVPLSVGTGSFKRDGDSSEACPQATLSEIVTREERVHGLP